jgi:hypothetical protein
MSTIDWSSVDLKQMASEEKRRLADICHKLNKFDNFFIQTILVVFLIHHLAIIYNAEQAMNIASITNKCVGAPASDIKKQCEIAIMSARIGVGLTTLMLLIVRSLDAASRKTAGIVQMIFGVGYLVSFIVSLSCSAIAKGKITDCSATQPPNQVGQPKDELDTVLGYMVNWSAVGMVASLLYITFYSVRAFGPEGAAPSAGEALATLSAPSSP